jgi:hypothetical protein
MPTPALNIPVRVNLDDFKKGMKDTSALAGTVTKQIAKQFVDMNASVLATSGAAGSAALGLRSVLGVLGPLGIAIGATTGIFKLMGYATDLAKEKIENFNETAEKAGKAGVSTDFFQRMQKSGEGLNLTIDDINAGLDRFAQKSQGTLGGSALEKTIAEMVKNGNFAGNGNVAAVSAATSNEAKLRATVALITDALEKGERLAALDLSEKAFGSKITDNLRANSNYLREMLDNADKIAASQIVSPEEIARAIDLKNRLEEAQRLLAERFKPIQNDLAKLGMEYQESWVNVYQNLASAVSVANDLYAALKDIPGIFAEAGNSPFWSKLTEYLKARGLTSDPAASGIIMRGEPGFETAATGSPSSRQLAAMLGNPNAVRQAMREAIDAQTKVRGDLSKAPPETPKPAEARDPFESALDQGNRRIAVIQAETATIGQNSEARQRAVLVAQLEEAAKKANAAAGRELYGVTEATNPAITEQANRMMAAAAAARQQQTAFAGMQDTLRFAGNELLNVFDRLGQKGTSFGDIMSDVFRNFSRQALMAAITGEGVFGRMFGLSGANGGVGGLMGAFSKALGFAEGGYVSGPGTGTSDSIPARLSHGEFVVNAKATARHLPLLKAVNDNAVPRFANGGLVGGASSAPMLASGPVIAPSIAVTVQGSPGMSPGDHARMGESIAKAAGDSIKQMIAAELRTQTRPGGVLSRR